MPDFSDVLKAAVRLHRDGKLPEAWQMYQEVLAQAPEQAPEHAAALNAAGLLLRQAGQFEPAQEYLRRAVAADPQEAAYHANLGEAYRGLGKLEEGLGCYEEALRLAPHEPVIHHHMGLFYEQLGRYDEAVLSYQKAASLRPDADTYHRLGTTLVALGRTSEAVESFQQALESDPNCAPARDSLNRLERTWPAAPANSSRHTGARRRSVRGLVFGSCPSTIPYCNPRSSCTAPTASTKRAPSINKSSTLNRAAPTRSGCWASRCAN
jgi:tetratricopeptide (TPR) repeat protein